MKNIKGVIFDLDHTLFDRYSTFTALQYDFHNAFKKYLSETTTPRDICVALINNLEGQDLGDIDINTRYMNSLSDFINNIKLDEKKLDTIKLRILELEADNIVKKESTAAMEEKIKKMIISEVDKK